MNMNVGLLERCNDGYGREQDHGQQTVAQDGDDAPNRHSLHAHQRQQRVHAQTSQQSNPVNVTEMNFPMLQDLEQGLKL